MGFVNLLWLLLCFAITSFALLVIAISTDGFANGLKIPDNIEIYDPIPEGQAGSCEITDNFQDYLILSLLSSKENDDSSITANIKSISKLSTESPDLLLRYLSVNPSWRVFQERNSIFATRRWAFNNNWQYELHGYYTSHDLGAWTYHPDFQTRFTIGFSGKPWARHLNGFEIMKPDETKQLINTKTNNTSDKIGRNGKPWIISNNNKKYSSWCLIEDTNLVVEIYEQSLKIERCLTKASLSQIDDEIKPLSISPDWDTICRILPDNSIKNGKPVFNLRSSFQPGIYDSEIWINPGEPGMIYLKAFEVTKGTQLSKNELNRYSNEWVGWSDNLEDLFLSNTHFTIFEGDWGKPYAARFEVWFKPDNGNPERKLIEKNFKIEGWQR